MADDGKEETSARILIVEDEAILAEDLELSLENLGYLVTGKVSTGEEAVKLAEESKPDLILMDIKLQGDIDGIEAADQIRMRLDIPVVYLTGYSESDVLERAKKTEPYGYIGKPISVSELRSTIETALYKHAADKKVRESEEKYRLLFSKEKDAIALTDAYSHDFIDVNEAFEALYGCTREEIIGKPATVVSAEPENTMATLRAATQPEGIIVPLRWHKTKDGHLFPVEISANAFTLQGRQVICSIMRDITDRKNAEEAIKSARNELEQKVQDRTRELAAANDSLRESQSTLRLITDSLPVLISYVDSDQRYRFCNKTYELWREIPREEIEGKHLREILGEEAYGKARPYVEAALSGSSVSYEMRANYQGGNQKHLNVIYVPDVDENGDTKGFAGLVTDITERKTMEEALRNSRDDLERRVMERTAKFVAVNEELKREILFRRDAEKELGHKTSLLTSLIEALPDCVHFKDINRRHLIINKAYEDFLGLNRQEIIGKTIEELVSLEMAPQSHKTDEAVIATKSPLVAEHSWVDQRGETRIFETRKFPILDEKGEILAVGGVSRDITERKRLEEYLRGSEVRLLDLYENAPNAYFTVGADGLIRKCNRGAEELLGYPKEMLEGKRVFELYVDGPEGKEKAAKVFQKSISGEQVTSEELQMQKADGSPVWISLSVNAIRDADGQVAESRSIVVDISDRKKAEEELIKQEALIRSVSDNFPSGMLYQALASNDGSRKFTYLSESVRDFYGCSPEEAMIDSELIYGKIFPDDRSRVLAEEEEAIDKLTPFRTEIRMISPSGDIRWSYFASNPTGLGDGSIAWSGLEVDITHLKNVEQQLKAALREKEVLLREIHHRVKNNLAMIQSLLRIQSRHIPSEGLSQTLEEMQHRIRSMALCHELLYQSENLSSIQTSKYVGNLISYLIASFSIIGKRIQIKQDIEELQLSIHMAVPIGFIFTELISNCYQHAFPERRNGQIEVSLRSLQGEPLELVVRDDGIGLPENMEVEKPKSLGYHLMGIFVRQLKGRMEIMTQKGTEVRITFPLK